MEVIRVEDGDRSSEWLEGLSEAARLIWTDKDARATALGDIVRAWRHGDPQLDELVHRLDRAVVEGLAALGLPRGSIASIVFEDVDAGPLGRKLLDRSIIFFGPAIEMIVSQGEPDRFFSTWIHESVHARQPYELGASAEYQQHRGFEEGLVEGLTRYVLERAWIPPVEGAFSYYVAVYEQLASALDIQVVELWRILWRYPAGTVRDGFVDVTDDVYQTRRGERFTSRQRVRFMATAIGLLDRTQDRALYDVAQIRKDWEQALP